MVMTVRRGGGVGMTLTPTTLTLATPGATRPTITRRTLEPPVENGTWPALEAALRELGLGDGTPAVAVALLPPLADTRRLPFPPLMDDQVAALASKNASRYFLTARGPQSVGVLRTGGARGGPIPFIASAMSTRLLNGIHSAVRQAGGSVSGVGPVESAWAAAGVALWPALGRRVGHLLVHEEGRISLLELQRGSLAAIRRFRPGAEDADLLAQAILAALPDGDLPQVGSFGQSQGQSELLRALAPRGVTVAAVPGDWTDVAEEADAMAAAFAGRATGPHILTDGDRARHAGRLKGIMYAVAAAAVLLLLGAAVLEYWGTKRELSHVVAQREALAPAVTSTMLGRTSVLEAYDRMAAIAQAERSAPRWAPIIGEVTRYLPRDSYLTALHLRGDTLLMQGLTSDYVGVFDGLDRSAELTALRSPGQVRREAQEGGGAREHFVIAAVRRDTTRVAVTSAAATSRPGAPGRSGAGGRGPGGTR